MIRKEGIDCITVPLHPSTDRPVMPHRDLVLKADGSDKRYIAISSFDETGPSLQISDFKIQAGEERTMVLTEGIFVDAAKNQKVGSVRIYEHGQTQMSETERIKFLGEVNQAKVDQVAT